MREHTTTSVAAGFVGAASDDPFAGQDYGIVPPIRQGENMLQSVKDAASSVKDHTGEVLDSAGQSARIGIGAFGKFFDENPLAVGAIAFLIGAAFAVSLPGTESENRLLGEARQKMMDRARDAGDELKQKVREAAAAG